MGPVTEVKDPADTCLSDYAGLTDAALRRRVERPDSAGPGCFMAEGTLAIEAALDSAYRLRSLLLTPAKLERLRPLLSACCAPVFVAPVDVMASVVGYPIHRGAVAVVDRRPLPTPERLLRVARRALVAEAINDHENLGGLFRNASAFGADAVLLCPRCCDPLYRRAVRVSVGHVLRVPYARFTSWPNGLDDVRSAGWTVLALTPDAWATPLTSVTRIGPRVALLVGAEGPGLSGQALARSDDRVRVVMSPGIDSLNVATAAAVALHHLASLG